MEVRDVLYHKTYYTVNNTMEDSRRTPRVLGDEEKGVEKQPRQETVWSSFKKRRFPLQSSLITTCFVGLPFGKDPNLSPLFEI